MAFISNCACQLHDGSMRSLSLIVPDLSKIDLKGASVQQPLFMEPLPFPLSSRSDCLNCQATGGARLEVEAEDSVPICPPGRVPHVCAGVAGALHGLNKMGRSPFRCCLLRAPKPKNEKDSHPRADDAKPCDLRFRGPLLETRNTILKQNCHLACPGVPWDHFGDEPTPILQSWRIAASRRSVALRPTFHWNSTHLQL